MKNDIYSFKEFIVLDENIIKAIIKGFRRLVKGGSNVADDIIDTAPVPKPGSGVVQGVGESMSEYIARLQESIMGIIRNGPGNTSSILYGHWQTIRNFIQNPTQANWEAVEQIIENAGYRIYPDGDGFGGGSMQSWVQDMGDPAQNEVFDAFWNYVFGIFQGMDNVPWNEWL